MDLAPSGRKDMEPNPSHPNSMFGKPSLRLNFSEKDWAPNPSRRAQAYLYVILQILEDIYPKNLLLI